MIKDKMDEHLYYGIKHIKLFKDRAKSDGAVWNYRWPDGQDIEVYERTSNKTLFYLGHDPIMAEYICSLHNMSNKLIREVEKSYDGEIK